MVFHGCRRRGRVLRKEELARSKWDHSTARSGGVVALENLDGQHFHASLKNRLGSRWKERGVSQMLVRLEKLDQWEQLEGRERWRLAQRMTELGLEELKKENLNPLVSGGGMGEVLPSRRKSIPTEGGIVEDEGCGDKGRGTTGPELDESSGGKLGRLRGAGLGKA